MGEATLKRRLQVSRRLRIWLVAGLTLALAMRLFALWLAWGTQPVGDAHNYLILAKSVLSGHGLANGGLQNGPLMPTASFPPVFPLMLALVGLVAPLTALTLTVLNTIIDLIAAALLGRLLRQWDLPDLALPVGVSYLLWPSIALMAPLAYKEGLVIALMLATLVTFQNLAKQGGPGQIALCGILAGAFILAQPALAPFLPLAFLVFLPAFASRARWLKSCVAVALVALIVMVPWWIRNALTFGTFIPLTTSGGLALWVGAHPAGGMRWEMPPLEWNMHGEISAAKAASSAAWEIILADPVAYLRRCLVKFPASFFQSNWAIDQLVFARGQQTLLPADAMLLRIIPTFAELGVVLTALIGMVRLPPSTAKRLVWAGVVQTLLFGIWFEFSERHRLFPTPFILILAVMVARGGRREEVPRSGAA